MRVFQTYYLKSKIHNLLINMNNLNLFMYKRAKIFHYFP